MSADFDSIIDEIRDLGFQAGAKLKRKKRFVDFNQGLDIRMLNKKHFRKLSTIELRPLRLAFDDYKLRDTYKKKVLWALDFGFKDISAYILYNYIDTPEQFYKRLMIASKINRRYGCRIYSFPMKYIPCDSKNREYIGPGWTKRQIRGVQCILNATHGIAPTHPEFMKRAFGSDIDEFHRIIQMPENYIVYRSKYSDNGCIEDWEKCYYALSFSDRTNALNLISKGKGKVRNCRKDSKISDFLKHYNNEYER